MMRAELERIVKAKITEALASPEWSSFDGAISAGARGRFWSTVTR